MINYAPNHVSSSCSVSFLHIPGMKHKSVVKQRFVFMHQTQEHISIQIFFFSVTETIVFFYFIFDYLFFYISVLPHTSLSVRMV